MAKKNNAVRMLEGLALNASRERYPDMPDKYRPAFKYSDTTANGLTKCIIDYLRFKGFHAERVNTMGVPMDGRKVVTDVIGRKRQIGSITWRKTTATKGSADIHALMDGKALFVEVKAQGDRMSADQWEYKNMVERAGGAYIIATSFEQFLKELKKAHKRAGEGLRE